MRYAARLCCIYDWSVYQSMDRDAEKMSKADCMEVVSRIPFIKDPLLEKLWSIVGDICPGTKNKDIEQADRWVIPELVKVYGQQKREILAVQRLREVFEAEGISLMDLQNQTGEPYVNFMRWTRFQTKIPWIVVLAVESMDSTKTDWKTSEVFKERDRLRRQYADASGTEKS